MLNYTYCDNDLYKAEAEFYFDIVKSAYYRHPQQDVIFSPYSTSLIVLLLYIIKYNTKQATQISSIFGNVDYSRSEILNYYNCRYQMSKLYTSNNQSFAFELNANLYMHNTKTLNQLKEANQFKFVKDSFTTTKIKYSTFSSEELNKYVREKTHNMIDNLINKKLTKNLKSILFYNNYFDGFYKRDFKLGEEGDDTYDEGDYNYEEENKYEEFHLVATNDHVQLHGIPFHESGKYSDFTFYFVLSESDNSDFIQNFTITELYSLIANATKQTREVYLPDVKVESVMDLKSFLEHKGLKSFFSDCNGKGKTNNLFPVNYLMQKSELTIDDKKLQFGSSSFGSSSSSCEPKYSSENGRTYLNHTPVLFFLIHESIGIVYNGVLQFNP